MDGYIVLNDLVLLGILWHLWNLDLKHLILFVSNSSWDSFINGSQILNRPWDLRLVAISFCNIYDHGVILLDICLLHLIVSLPLDRGEVSVLCEYPNRLHMDLWWYTSTSTFLLCFRSPCILICFVSYFIQLYLYFPQDFNASKCLCRWMRPWTYIMKYNCNTKL